MVREINAENVQAKDEKIAVQMQNLQKLYELYQNGAISEAEYNARKDIILNN